MQPEFFTTAHACLMAENAGTKLAQVAEFNEKWKQGGLSFHPAKSTVFPVPVPGRPAKPDMVSALAVDKRKLSTAEGRAALIHALAHIEFNAIKMVYNDC